MNLELNSQEEKALSQLLSRYLSELHHEISHTDTREFRQILKNQAEVLEVIKNKLQNVEEVAAFEGHS